MASAVRIVAAALSGPTQATTTELSSYGVRTLDVLAADDLFVPGYEYHFLDETSDPPELVTQIPEGFAGPPNPLDASRCDASPWLDRLPIVRAFRKRLPQLQGSSPARSRPAMLAKVMAGPMGPPPPP